eukprot:TRINITY_DN3467_c1_g1_i1.p1 TRINITY_DN3467_c1_g1~~TRINITY_DN3467_c1_g1_i1.p1  ORF type:complete len:256 (+),score=91.98 TRINITY_DN3467_c1_g1_i1:110-769(+)
MPSVIVRLYRRYAPTSSGVTSYIMSSSISCSVTLSVYGTPNRLVKDIVRILGKLRFKGNYALELEKVMKDGNPIYECTVDEPQPDSLKSQSSSSEAFNALHPFCDTVVLPVVMELMLNSGWSLAGTNAIQVPTSGSARTAIAEMYIFHRSDPTPPASVSSDTARSDATAKKALADELPMEEPLPFLVAALAGAEMESVSDDEATPAAPLIAPKSSGRRA